MARRAFGAVPVVPLSLIGLAVLYVVQKRKTAATPRTGLAEIPA
jgi:hypothetical protein